MLPDSAGEAAIWAAFLSAVGAIEDFVLFHYGSYESHFLDRMEANRTEQLQGLVCSGSALSSCRLR